MVADLGVTICNIRQLPDHASDFEFTSEGSVDVAFAKSVGFKAITQGGPFDD